MKSNVTKLTDNKAQKELKQFLILGYAAAIIALFTLGFLAIAGLAFGARCLALCGHKGNKAMPRARIRQVASGILVIFSAIEFTFYLSA
ncbi:MAG TPA: hypothetical protein VFT16_00180 [Candidatus Saccharimonadales bacterium]|nr:hypothetical protein [Candidatus Saccharimonadales bacterium]